MNKKLVFCVMLACLLFLINITTLFAQAHEQRLVGSWTGLHHTTVSLTFNANGTMSVQNIHFDGFAPTHWAAAGDGLLLFIPSADAAAVRRVIRYFHISNDGRTLIISTIAVEGIGGTGSIGSAFRRN